MKPLKGVRVVLGADPGTELGEVETALGHGGASVQRVGTLTELRKAVSEERADVLLVHVYEPGEAFGDVMKDPEELRHWPPVVILTFTEAAYLPAMRAGVFDCLVLPIDATELERIVTLALESRQIQLPVAMQP
jgi:DNA-binding NtrC family response regulator